MLLEFKEELKDTQLERLLIKQISTCSKDILDICDLSWDKYVEITNLDFKINPRDILNNRIYNNYKLKRKNSIKSKEISYYKIIL